VSIDISSQMWVLDATGAGLRVTLPALASTPKGGPIFVLTNVGANSVSVRDSAANEVLAFAAARLALVYHGLDSAGASKWYFAVFT
jgi:hypothetical protein